MNHEVRRYSHRANTVLDPDMDWVESTLAKIKAHHDKRGLPPLTAPPPPPPEPFPEPAKLIAIDKLTGQVYRDLEYLDAGCIGMAEGVAYYLPEDSYEVDFE